MNDFLFYLHDLVTTCYYYDLEKACATISEGGRLLL